MKPQKIYFVVLAVLFFVSFTYTTNSATITTYSDRMSDSAPSESANHNIQFTTTVAIPVNGFIRFTPEDGVFTIPSSNFDVDNVDLYVATSSGFVLRSATGTPSATEDGISITTGTSGSVEVTLNSTVGIPAGAGVLLVIGNETTNSTSTDVGITNPSSIGTYSYTITTGIGAGGDSTSGKLAIVRNVHVGDIDTRETIPPVRFNGAPSGDLSGTTQNVELSLETNEFALCRYSTASDTPYFSMGFTFGTVFSTIHTKEIAVASSTSYSFFVRCIDDEDNFNIDDYVISFSILPPPDGTPGDPDGDAEGEGDGTGEGEGEADPGDGSPTGGDNADGGTAGGGGGGGGGGGSGPSSGGSGGSGGFEGSDKPYQSGDARVIINGYAFPNSTIVVLVDGQIADQVTSNSVGSFSSTLDDIARGAYTFGVYGIDKDGVRSSTFSTTFTVTGSRGSTLSNINVMPSIKVTPDPVTPGQVATIKGYTIPNATVTIENQNDKTSASLKTFTTTSKADGSWSVEISTAGFSVGTYKVRAKAKQEEGVSTNFSGFTYYGVGQVAKGPRTADLNRDGKVNLIDFSILLFWWNTNGGNSNPPADINADGKVGLTDFSIMLFQWTG